MANKDEFATTIRHVNFIVNGFNEMTANIRNILNDNGWLVTISLVYKNNKKENAHVMICGDMHLTERIGSKEKVTNQIVISRLNFRTFHK